MLDTSISFVLKDATVFDVGGYEESVIPPF